MKISKPRKISYKDAVMRVKLYLKNDKRRMSVKARTSKAIRAKLKAIVKHGLKPNLNI